jgi:hypothetical protein
MSPPRRAFFFLLEDVLIFIYHIGRQTGMWIAHINARFFSPIPASHLKLKRESRYRHETLEVSLRRRG